MKFDLGQVVMTKEIAEKMSSLFFQTELSIILKKYQNCDWGITSEENSVINDKAIENGDKIFAIYKTCKREIWIITEQDKGVTTILFPEEIIN